MVALWRSNVAPTGVWFTICVACSVLTAFWFVLVPATAAIIVVVLGGLALAILILPELGSRRAARPQDGT